MPELNVRPTGKKVTKKMPNEGDVVLMADNTLPRNQWHGKDGVVRVVDIKPRRGYIEDLPLNSESHITVGF